jgi:hypothetical protein
MRLASLFLERSSSQSQAFEPLKKSCGPQSRILRTLKYSGQHGVSRAFVLHAEMALQSQESVVFGFT